MSTDAADRYAIDALLGRGGMGVVHRAVDRATGQSVALKRLIASPGDERAFRRRFAREVRAMARIHHPNVVGIHASGEDDGGPWFAMDLCDGGSLADRLREGSLPPGEARALATDVLAALAAIHGAGLIHRDVKPHNILRDGSRWRVSDFGIVRDTTGATGATTVTKAGMIIGTPDYLAPEHLGEGPVGPAADLYALGAMLHHALTGAPPYRADNALRLAMLHATAPAPALPPAIRAADPGLGHLVEGLLRKNPRDRPTVAEAQGMLAGWADAPTLVAMAVDADTSPAAPTLAPPLRRPRPRRRHLVAAGLGIATLALGAAWIAGGDPTGDAPGAVTTAAPSATRDLGTPPVPTVGTPVVPPPVVSPPAPAAPISDDGDDEYGDEDDGEYEDEHEDEYEFGDEHEDGDPYEYDEEHEDGYDEDDHGGDDDGYVYDGPGERAGAENRGRRSAKGDRESRHEHQRHR